MTKSFLSLSHHHLWSPRSTVDPMWWLSTISAKWTCEIPISDCALHQDKPCIPQITMALGTLPRCGSHCPTGQQMVARGQRVKKLYSNPSVCWSILCCFQSPFWINSMKFSVIFLSDNAWFSTFWDEKGRKVWQFHLWLPQHNLAWGVLEATTQSMSEWTFFEDEKIKCVFILCYKWV